MIYNNSCNIVVRRKGMLQHLTAVLGIPRWVVVCHLLSMAIMLSSLVAFWQLAIVCLAVDNFTAMEATLTLNSIQLHCQLKTLHQDVCNFCHSF